MVKTFHTRKEQSLSDKPEDKKTKDAEILPDKIGSIRISDEVVATIAGLAATEVKGVAGMSGGMAGSFAIGISEALGRKNLGKGIKVEVGEDEASLDIYIIVDFGVRIPDVAWEVQENVKTVVEKMTGLKVSKVNIHVQGVLFPSKKSAVDDGQEETEV